MSSGGMDVVVCRGVLDPLDSGWFEAQGRDVMRLIAVLPLRRRVSTSRNHRLRKMSFSSSDRMCGKCWFGPISRGSKARLSASTMCVGVANGDRTILAASYLTQLLPTQAKVLKIVANRPFGFSYVRLLPKEKGVRPIVNMRRKFTKNVSRFVNILRK